MSMLKAKPNILLNFNNDVLDSENDIIPSSTTLVKSSNKLCTVKNHASVANKTFDISGKYIQIKDSTSYDTTNDFTLKFAEYITSYPTSTGCMMILLNVSGADVSNQYAGIAFGYSFTSGVRYLGISSTGTSWESVAYNYALPTLVLNTWSRWEIDYVASIKTLYLFKEGILINSFVLTAHPYYNTAYSSYINEFNGANSFINGIIADFDFIKGICTHTTNFTPDSISSTVINKIFSPFLSDITYKNGRSLYLDGSSYLSFPNFTLDTTKDFTLSINVYLISATNASSIFCFNCKIGANNCGGGIMLRIINGNITILASSGSILPDSSSWDICYDNIICDLQSVLNKWVNFELNYIDSIKTLYLFKDGILKYTFSSTGKRIGSVNYGTNYIGMYYNYFQTGYYDNFLVLPYYSHSSSFTVSNDEYIYIPYIINKVINPYRLYGSVNKSTITLNVLCNSISVSYALYIDKIVISTLSSDIIRTIDTNKLNIGTNTLSIQTTDGTVIDTFDIIVEEVYRQSTTRTFNDFEGGYDKKEVLVNKPVVNETITGVIDTNNNYSSKIDKFITKIQNN